MSLSREPLRLEPDPRSVKQARHWTAQVVRAMGRPDLCESAELAVSELVTNALLHANPPLSVRLRGTRDHPRIEVADGSSEPLVLAGPDDEAGLGLDLAVNVGDPVADAPGGKADADGSDGPDPQVWLSTLGRGLGIVSMCARAWGADIREEGKVVWFEPIGKAETDAPSRGAIFTQVDDLARRVPDEPLSPVLLERVPLTLYTGFRQHVSELRRELRLLALAHEAKYPLAANLGTLLTDFEAHLRHAEAAGVGSLPPSSTGTRDLAMLMPASTPQIVHQMIDLLDLADAFCHAERLLALARTPSQRAFQRWFLTELIRQAEGQPPRPWIGNDPTVDQTAS